MSCMCVLMWVQDSGGFQMVSLLAFANVTEDGVNFRSPFDGKEMLLTPEKSIELQNTIGSDIMMQLDDVVSGGQDKMHDSDDCRSRRL